MRIVIIHHDLFFRGGQYVASKLAEGLFNRGHQVDVVVSRAHTDVAAAHGAENAFRLPQGVGFHILPSRSASHNVFAMGHLLRRLKPDLIIPNTYHYNLCVYLAQLIFSQKIPVLYIEHCLTRPVPFRSKLTLEYWIARRSINSASRVVAVSDGVKRCVERSYGTKPDKVIRIYNPIFETDRLPAVEESHLHPKLIGEHPYTVVGAGALSERKDFPTLISAFSVFHKRVPNSQLLIFGRDSAELLGKQLQRQIEGLGLNGVAHLAGFTKYLQENLQCSQLFVSVSREETFGIVLIEALAAGNAVVSTDCPVGPREVLRNGALGQLVQVGDIQALSEAMMRAYRHEYDQSAIFSMDEYVLNHVLDLYEHEINVVRAENEGRRM